MTLEELANELDFGDRSKGVPVEYIKAAAAACRELDKQRAFVRSLGGCGNLYPVTEITDAALKECK